MPTTFKTTFDYNIVVRWPQPRQRLHERGLICNHIVFDVVIHLFTRHRSRLLLKPCTCWFETSTKSGAFSKPCSFICHVCTSIWILFWHEICIVDFKILNLARSACLTYKIMTWIFWRKWFRVNTSKPHRFWCSFEIMKLHLCKRCPILIWPREKMVAKR